MTDYIVSTDADLASEENRRYNMAGECEYICVQSIPSLKAEDQAAAISPKGWRVTYRRGGADRTPVDASDPGREIFDLGEVLKEAARNPGLLSDTTLYKEALVDKTLREANPEWEGARREQGTDKPVDRDNNPIPRTTSSTRSERVIVTYGHDFALCLGRTPKDKERRGIVLIANIITFKSIKDGIAKIVIFRKGSKK